MTETTDTELAELRKQVADRMADAVVGPLIERLDRVEAEKAEHLSIISECEDLLCAFADDHRSSRKGAVEAALLAQGCRAILAKHKEEA